MKNKKGVSPVIATVLLVMIVVILAIIILVWSQGFIKETILKEINGESKRAEAYCREIRMIPIINEDDSFGFENTGNVPIYEIQLKTSGDGSSELETIEEPVNPGFATILTSPQGGDYQLSAYEEVKVIPVILGTTESGDNQPFTCPEINALKIK
ncbi:hypothetical protein HOD75_02020 [archaeon]|jgi:flagellin-like protein|nr:hypothetical protein [archaeon]MBT4241653.1 hypothetical protein [archaeon]MBT4418048.1 hypothetical protein [archaeon]